MVVGRWFVHLAAIIVALVFGITFFFFFVTGIWYILFFFVLAMVFGITQF